MAEANAKPSSFEVPPCAREHCRHYEYHRDREWSKSGPRCGVGVDLSAPGAARACMPDPAERCARREEWTAAERETWEAFVTAGRARLISAIGAVPAPIPLRTGGKVECPSCTGTLHYGRWPGGAELVCSTPGCTSAHFKIEAGADWPCPVMRADRGSGG